jgi:predicted amidophosphoribosyltransferase
VDLLSNRQGRRCVRCGYDLRGLASQGWCPECGAPFRFSSQSLLTWDDLAKALAGPLAMKPDDITQNMWVFRRIHEVSVRMAKEVEQEVELEELE